MSYAEGMAVSLCNIRPAKILISIGLVKLSNISFGIELFLPAYHIPNAHQLFYFTATSLLAAPLWLNSACSSKGAFGQGFKPGKHGCG